MCPITLTALGTMVASAGAIGTATGAAVGAVGGPMAGMIGGGLFSGMSTAALGMSTLTTAISGAGMLLGQRSQADAIEAQNKAQRQRYLQQTKISHQALEYKYDAMADRQSQDNRLYQQQMASRQAAYDDAMADVTTSAAESGATGINLAAIRQSMDMEMGRGNVALATNLRWRSRQYQRTQLGYQTTAAGQILATTPQYEAPPSLVGPLLGTAGVGLGSLGKFGGEKWLSTVSSKYAKT